nr:LON peptidase substrate-binding domain-containing protein [Nakamurella flavida]
MSLPLFPLGTVLFPGVVLPLHVFEARYRALVQELVALPDPPRRFGVVAIKAGHEVGVDGVTALHDIGCTADLRRVEQYPDGRFDIVAVGLERFRLGEVTGDELLRSEVELLADPVGPQDAALAATAGRLFVRYREALLTAQGTSADPMPDLPADPAEVASLIAASMVADVTDKQTLLAAPGIAARLREEVRLLRRELGLLAHSASRPAVELGRAPYTAN